MLRAVEKISDTGSDQDGFSKNVWLLKNRVFVGKGKGWGWEKESIFQAFL